MEPPTDSLNQIRRATKRSAKRRPRAAVRLNGVIGDASRANEGFREENEWFRASNQRLASAINP